MHELGIVMHVIRQVEDVAAKNGVKEVTKLHIEVGEVSSVVPALFEDCFAWAKKRTQYLQNAQLDLIVLEAVSYCRTCRQTFRTAQYAKVCPHCGGEDTYLATGNEISIRDIEVLSG